jgi:hypothetical protein
MIVKESSRPLHQRLLGVLRVPGPLSPRLFINPTECLLIGGMDCYIAQVLDHK